MIINLQRDACFIDLDKAALNWGTAVVITEAVTITANTPGIVYDSYSSVRASRSSLLTLTGDGKVIGLFMRPPTNLSPYRVKCYATSDDTDLEFSLIIGWSSNVIDGTDDNVKPWEALAFTKHLDELVMVEPEVPVGTQAIFFGIMVQGASTGAFADVHVSAQRLATSPPQFDQSVS